MSVAFSIVLPGTIGNYNDLVSKVAAWLDRDDLAVRVPDFIALAEARFNRILRTPEMETGLVKIDSTENAPLPDDFLAMRTIYIEGSPDRPLRAMAPAALPRDFSGAAGMPQAYAIAGRMIRLAPPPNAPVTLAIDYYARIPSLGVGTPTNWLLDNHPDIYLYGALVQAEAFTSNDDRIQLWKTALDEALGELTLASSKARWGSGPLVPNSVAQVRGARC